MAAVEVVEAEEAAAAEVGLDMLLDEVGVCVLFVLQELLRVTPCFC